MGSPARGPPAWNSRGKRAGGGGERRGGPRAGSWDGPFFKGQAPLGKNAPPKIDSAPTGKGGTVSEGTGLMVFCRSSRFGPSPRILFMRGEKRSEGPFTFPREAQRGTRGKPKPGGPGRPSKGAPRPAFGLENEGGPGVSYEDRPVPY